jgi:hypothetical protein
VATGDGNEATGPLHRLRQRWLTPSPPLPIDEVAQSPSAEATDDPDEQPESDGNSPAGD